MAYSQVAVVVGGIAHVPVLIGLAKFFDGQSAKNYKAGQAIREQQEAKVKAEEEARARAQAAEQEAKLKAAAQAKAEADAKAKAQAKNKKEADGKTGGKSK
ncbi:hypothetical protein [Prochlorococcus sp. MIT 1341]|uniref:hypothetical protein n=1 Tax=Prochlorococcus sp. MIT 1341 TaxID=3096221 RepID=UPI002A753D1C|nr:hypothetical protein [Prochlorococcus sp. MIT 1341]